MAGQTMHRDSGIDRIGKSASWRPDVHDVAGARQLDCNQPRIVTHSAGLRRIAAGYYVPMLQTEGLAELEFTST
jgi:hypothetical protein